MKAMILAAGKGKRMLPLTASTPKPLLPVHDLSLIEHLLMQLAMSGFTEVVINCAYLGQMIMQQLGDGARYGVSITFSYEGEEPLETGGGIFKALPVLGNDPFLLISGDLWTDYPFEQLRTRALRGLAHLIMVENPDFKPQGDFAFEEHYLTLQGLPTYTYANIGVISPALFSGCAAGTYPVATLFKEAIQQKQVTGEVYRGVWRNIGTPLDYELLLGDTASLKREAQWAR